MKEIRTKQQLDRALANDGWFSKIPILSQIGKFLDLGNNVIMLMKRREARKLHEQSGKVESALDYIKRKKKENLHQETSNILLIIEDILE